MVEKLKPIETEYEGVLFRSRTEARWAVYFDSLGIRWEYEAEGFNLPSGERYLPDFWLRDFLMFAEVKGGPFTHAEEVKSASLDYPCIMLDYAPERMPYFIAGASHRFGSGGGRWPVGRVVGFDDCGCWAVCLAQYKKKDAAPARLRFWTAEACRESEHAAECEACSGGCEDAVNAAKRYRFWR